MSRRNRSEIIYDMLDALAKNRGRLKPTRLLYKANLSHAQMKDYVEELVQKDLIVLVQEKKAQYYEITEEGYAFLHKLNRVLEMSDALGL